MHVEGGASAALQWTCAMSMCVRDSVHILKCRISPPNYIAMFPTFDISEKIETAF